MKRFHSATLFASCCLLAAPLAAQTQIGGGTCSSATVNGAYAVSLTGRQVNSSGGFQSVFQSNGSATFDGINKVTITLAADTIPSIGTPMTWSGTYSMQANCAGVIAIPSGGVTLNLTSYAQGDNFQIAGNDATYFYNGSGNTQSTGCSVSTFSGVYTFNATGYGLTSGAVSGVDDAVGLLQFDGQGTLTGNITSVVSGKGSSTLTVTGPYTVSSTCLGSAMVTDSKSNSYVMSFSAYTGNAMATSDFFASLAQSGKFLITGGAHAAYGQVAPSASDLPGVPESTN